MTDIVKVAIITGAITLINGPLVISIISRQSKRNDEVKQIQKDVKNLVKAVNRIAIGLTLGLENDSVIFDAFRKNSINGESEIQERKMMEYFQNCTTEAFGCED